MSKSKSRTALRLVSEHRDKSRGKAAAAKREVFKGVQLSNVWESTTKWAHSQTASFTKPIKLLTGRVSRLEVAQKQNAPENQRQHLI